MSYTDRGAPDNPLTAFGINPQNPPTPKIGGLPASTYTATVDGRFRLLLDSWEWVYQSPIFDLRPELRADAPLQSAIETYPINRSAALGAGGVLKILVYSGSRTVDLARFGGLRAYAIEAVNNIAPSHMVPVGTLREQPMFLMYEWTEVSRTLQAGGLTQAINGLPYRGASLLTFNVPSLRYWQVMLRFNYIPGTLPDPNSLGLRLQVALD